MEGEYQLCMCLLSLTDVLSRKHEVLEEVGVPCTEGCHHGKLVTPCGGELVSLLYQVVHIGYQCIVCLFGQVGQTLLEDV